MNEFTKDRSRIEKMQHELDDFNKKSDENYKREMKNNKIKKLAIYSAVAIMGITSVVLVKKNYDKTHTPVAKLGTYALENAGLVLTDDGREVTPEFFDNIEEAVEFKKDNGVGTNEIRDYLVSYCEKEGLNPDGLVPQIEHISKELFAPKVINITVEEINKTK